MEKRTKAVRETQAKIDASGKKRKVDESLKDLRNTLKERNEELLEAVRDITEPVRARMQEMIENREDELFGAKQMAEQLAVEEKLGFADLADMRETVETLRPGYDAYLTTEAAIKDKAKGKTALEAAEELAPLEKKLKRLKLKYDEYLKAREFLDERMAALAEVRGEKTRAEQDFEQARVFNSVVLPRLEQLDMESTAVPVDYEAAYGPREISALLDQAVVNRVLTKDSVEFTRWLISKNPSLAVDLEVELATAANSEYAAGTYYPLFRRIVLIPRELEKSPSLGVHEILHHTERMLPAKFRKAIRQLWKRDFDAFRDTAQDAERAYMDALAAMHAATDENTFNEARDRAFEMIGTGKVSGALYCYFDASEYWAEFGSEILAQRFEARNSTMAKIKQWYREMLEKLKDIFGMDSLTPVIGALDNILNGDGSFVTGSMIFDPRFETDFAAPKIPLKLGKKLRESGENISEGLKRAELTQDVQEVAEASLGTIKNHLASKDVIGYLKSVWNSTDARTLATFLTTLPTSGIVGWMKKEIPGLQTIVDKVNQMLAMKRNLLANAEDIANEINAFMQKHGDQLLAKTMTVARINEVSLGQFATVAEALQKDPVLVEIRKQLAQSSADPDKTSRLKKAENARVLQVRDSYMLWEQLAEQPGGQQLYLRMRDYYKTSYIAMRAAQDKVIANFPDKGLAQNLLSKIRRDMEEAAVRDESDVYKDLPPDVFPKDYFPFMRFGKYYLKVAPYKGNSYQFRTFDTPSQRNAALQEVSALLKVDTDSNVGKRIFEIGDDIAVLQEQFNTDDEMMRKVFEELGKAKANTNAVGKTDIRDMMNSIYQIYLMSTPERSLRRSFLKAEDVTGMSMDVLRTFSSRAASVSNQLARAEYGNDVRLAIEAAYDNINPDKTRDIDDRRRLETIVTEIANRAEAELNPQAPGMGDTIANNINRMSFVYFLTSAATAAIQFLSIPQFVVPNLGARYGYGEATRVWSKYMKLWETVGSGDGKGTADVLSSKLVKSNPVLADALRAGLRRGVLDSMGQTLVNNDAATAGSSRSKAAQYALKLHDVMTYMFTSSENITKQAAYLMAFELEHNKLLAKEKPQTKEEKKDIFDRAVSSALETVSDTIGDYSSMERPSIMSGNVGRMVFLFKAYAVARTKWLVGSMRRALGGGDFTTEERNMARKDLIGAHLMTFLLSGTTGLPLYSLVAAVLKALEDDEDERENRLRNPYTADSYDLWFRYEWLPRQSIFAEAEIFGRPLSAVMANGPISEFTGVNIASRTGLDLKQMWWRDSPDGDTPLGSIANMLLSNIAPAGVVTNVDKGFKEFKEGDWKRGLEYLAPAFFRGAFSAERLATTGLETGTGKVIMSPEEFSAANLAAQFLGLQPLQASKIQQMRVKIESFDASTNKERTRLMGVYADAVQDGADAETIRRAAEDIVEFNDTYPLPEFMISMEDLERSMKTRARQVTVRGVTVTKKEQSTKERAFEQIR